MKLGLENCLDSPPPLLRRARFGLLCNQASVDAQFRHGCELLDEVFPGQLAALFSPQHGLWSEEQDNMIESGHGRHPRLGVPVYSLYGASRRPLPEQLAGLDGLVVDLQDVGVRVYTYVWTLSYCLEACAEVGLPVIVLDRPNPLGGELVEGARLDLNFASFIGRAALPMRHGLTVGELARHLNEVLAVGAEVHVVAMRGWRRQRLWQDLQRPWLPPSPNLPRLEGVQVYPGMVLVEGTNLSEGRGTTTPFEVVGAPFIDGFALEEALRAWQLPGVTFRPITFRPTFQKWQDQLCGGVFLHPLDVRCFRPYATALTVLATVKQLWPEQFAWLDPPYEYEREKRPIDILTGGTEVRELFSGHVSAAAIEALSAVEETQWWSEASPALLYE